MTREPHIPLFLWIATALLVHVTGGEGVQRVAEVLGDRLEVQRFADSVRRHVLSSSRPVMEVALLEDGKEEPRPEDDAKPDEQDPDERALASEEPSPTSTGAMHDTTPPRKKPDEKEKPPEEAEKPRDDAQKAKPEAPPKPPDEKKQEDKPKQDFPAVKVPNRIAALQHVEDKNQADNPNAEFIGDDANHVREQTQARITATDQNDANPSPGSAHDGPTDEPGNAHVTDIAHSDDAPGAIDHSPNEHAAGQKVAASVEHTAPGSSRSVRVVEPDSHKGLPAGEAKGAQKSPDQTKKQDERLEVAGSRATPESPDTMTSRGGSEIVAEATEGRVARESERARPKRLPPVRGQPGALDFLGLGANGTTPGGINLNLTTGAAFAAVGRDQLGRERLADGERRRSRHRGSWKALGIERWRASIENYNSSVKPGNQTALNTARVPFATYLNQIHNRLHPIFADSFLGSLEGLSSDNPLNKPDMRTNLEIILDKDEGKIVKMGITRSSGSTIFDVAALESVQNAAPFGKPPAVIVSPDGNVYLHWEFYRNPYYACSTYFAHPFLLKANPESAPPHLPPPTPATPTFGPHEQPVPGRGDLGFLERAPTRSPL